MEPQKEGWLRGRGTSWETRHVFSLILNFCVNVCVAAIHVLHTCIYIYICKVVVSYHGVTVRTCIDRRCRGVRDDTPGRSRAPRGGVPFGPFVKVTRQSQPRTGTVGAIPSDEDAACSSILCPLLFYWRNETNGPRTTHPLLFTG